MSRLLIKDALLKWAPFLVLLVLLLVFPIFEMVNDWSDGKNHLYLIDSNFLSVRNFARITISAAPALMVALGVTFIIIMGSIDLSMEGTVSVTAVAFAYAFLALGGMLNSIAWLAIPLALGIGAAIGLLNGLVHVKLKIPSFMASLAMGFVGTGFALLLTGGERVRVDDPLFRSLLTERWLGFPIMIYVAGIFLMWFLQTRTKLGRNFYAVGGGEELAASSGLNVAKVRILGFMLAGICYGMGGLLAVAKIGIAETVTGANFMFISITAVVVGGTALWGGIGGVLNTLVGVLIVFVINNGMVVIGLPSYIQTAILGILVILAVVLSTDRKSISFVK